MLKIDLNCDMGESTELWSWSIEQDLSLLPYFSSVNIACGIHAGDPDTMRQLVLAAGRLGVSVGAHPGFPDREHFGRNPMTLRPEEIYTIVSEQIAVLSGIAQECGGRLQHIKPHGALYNMASVDPALAAAICSAVKDADRGLIVYGLSGSALLRAAAQAGLDSCPEGFADRVYLEDGSLSPRTGARALIENPARAAAQALQMVEEGMVMADSGKKISLEVGTICMHSDGGHALACAQELHKVLMERGIRIQAPRK